MRDLLDRLLAKRRLSLYLPLVIAAALYVLFVLFGQAEDKMQLLWGAPLMAVIWYLGVCFVLGFQTKNPFGSEKLLDFMELAMLLFFGFGAAVFTLRFLVNMAYGFAPTLCGTVVTWSAVTLVHGRRN